MKSHQTKFVAPTLSCLVLLTACSGDKQFSTAAKPAEPAKPKCEEKKIAPVIGDVKPIELWHWDGLKVSPKSGPYNYSTTFSSPVIGDLDDDKFPEIVVVASGAGAAYHNASGALVILDGKTGKRKMAAGGEEIDAHGYVLAEVSTTPSLFSTNGESAIAFITYFQKHPSDAGTPTATLSCPSAASPANCMEGYARHINIQRFKAGKTVKMVKSKEQTFCGPNCMTHVADLDNDGKPEILAGDLVVNADGEKKLRLSPPPTFLPYRNTTLVAELSSKQAGPEIISNGAQVYSNAGKRLWDGGCYGYSAVANLDGKANRLVCVGYDATQLAGTSARSHGWLMVFDGDGKLQWKNKLPGLVLPEYPAGLTDGGGPANVGNFNSEPNLEIGVAVGTYYAVFDASGAELWRYSTKDGSSMTGSTVFDLNGDGKVEVLYNDEAKLRIFSGEGKKDGSGKTVADVLWETDNPSGTLYEYPLIANIDESPSVEIVVSSPGLGGVRAFADPSKNWMSSRNLWNQYNYFTEAVSDALTPLYPTGLIAGFRVNTLIRPDDEKTCK